MEQFFKEVMAEVERCRAKFPTNQNVLLALQEELGEVTQAALEGRLDDAREEIIQVAALCFRFYDEGDAQFHGLRSAVQVARAPVPSADLVFEILGPIADSIDYWTTAVHFVSFSKQDSAVLSGVSDDEFKAGVERAASVADWKVKFTNMGNGRLDREAALQDLLGVTDLRFWDDETNVEFDHGTGSRTLNQLEISTKPSDSFCDMLDGLLLSIFMDGLASDKYDPSKGVFMGTETLPPYSDNDAVTLQKLQKATERRQVLTEAFELAWAECHVYGETDYPDGAEKFYVELHSPDGIPKNIVSVTVPNTGSLDEKLAVAKPLLLSKFLEAHSA